MFRTLHTTRVEIGRYAYELALSPPPPPVSLNTFSLRVRQTSSAKASEICPERLEVRRSAKSLDTEISRLKLKISSQQDQQGDPEDIIRYTTSDL